MLYSVKTDYPACVGVYLVSSISQNVIDKCVSLLKTGGVVAYPTETLYALGASVSNLKATQRVIDIKNRPMEKGLPVVIASIHDLNFLSEDIPQVAYSLATNFWPGPLTLVVNARPEIPDLITGGRNSVAVRIPNHPIPLAILQKLREPIIATSANITGEPPCLTANDVRKMIGDMVDITIPGHTSSEGLPSTIVDLTLSTPKILRKGAVEQTVIEKCLGQKLLSN